MARKGGALHTSATALITGRREAAAAITSEVRLTGSDPFRPIAGRILVSRTARDNARGRHFVHRARQLAEGCNEPPSSWRIRLDALEQIAGG